MGHIQIKGHPGTKKRIKVPKVVSNSFEGYVLFDRDGIGTDAYKGQFGFDKMDLMNLQYHKIAGKHKYVSSKENYEFDPTTSATEFAKLEKQYDNFQLKNYDNGTGKSTYYIPWYSAFKSSTHKLALSIMIAKNMEGTIKLEAKSDIKLSKTEISTVGKTAGSFDEVLEISFKNSLSTHSKIEAKFYDTARTKYPTGLLIGAINVYKNNEEYNMQLKYVKVFIKGSIKVKGETEKILLDPVDKKYSYYTSKIKSYKDDIKEKNVELINVRANPPSSWNVFASTEEDIIEDIDDLKQELAEISRQYSLAKQIDLVQHTNLNSSEGKINKEQDLLRNLFGQALVKYTNSGVVNLTIEADNYKDILDFHDDIEIYNHNGDFKIKYTTKNNRYDSATFLKTTINAYKEYKQSENYIFMIPFNMHASNSEKANLLGQAEGVDYKGHRAIMLPQADAVTIVHEIGHLFNLHHTFDNHHINFCKGATDNIMDYEDFAINHPKVSTRPIKRKRTFFKWQWEIIKKDPHLTKKIV